MSDRTPGRLDRALAAATLPVQPSGSALRLERQALRVTVIAQAAAMGFTREYLRRIEWRDDPLTPELVERYRTALRGVGR